MRIRHTARQRGFALLIVLWTLALLALIGAHITGLAREVLHRSAALRAAAEASGLADGLVRQAIFHLLDGTSPDWRADGAVHAVRLPQGHGAVTIEDIAGRINISTASTELLSALLRRLGAADEAAQEMAGAITFWHLNMPDQVKQATYRQAGLPWAPLGERFETIAELGLVAGLTPDLVARLTPYVTVWGDGRIDIAKAPPLVSEVLRSAGADWSPPDDTPSLLIAEITATVELPQANARRHAVVEINRGGDDGAHPYHILAWD